MSENTFTDEDGDVYSADRHGNRLPIITLAVQVDGEGEPRTIDFRAADATKIIALIAEAAA